MNIRLFFQNMLEMNFQLKSLEWMFFGVSKVGNEKIIYFLEGKGNLKAEDISVK